MATQTTNLGLTKPDLEDLVSPVPLGENYDKIDDRLRNPFIVTIATTDWAQSVSTSKYYYEYTFTGMTEDDLYSCGLVTSNSDSVSEDEVAEYSKIDTVETLENKIRFTCKADEEPPSVTLNITFAYNGKYQHPEEEEPGE